METETESTHATLKTDSIVIQIIKHALEEDIGAGDLTASSIIPDDLKTCGIIIAKEDGVIAGLDVAYQTFAAFDGRVQITHCHRDGAPVQTGATIAAINGPARSIVTAERVALNFLQRMSGIATLTNKFVQKVSGTKTKILDTRKTVPGLRTLDKQAVRLGGGFNHRAGLFDMILIKENHSTIAGGIQEAVARARKKYRNIEIEVEVKNLDELAEAIACKPNRILLDNMDIETLKKAVTITNGSIPLEASGNITLDTVKDIARTGVDFISVGALTHSPTALDISLLLHKQ